MPITICASVTPITSWLDTAQVQNILRDILQAQPAEWYDQAGVTDPVVAAYGAYQKAITIYNLPSSFMVAITASEMCIRDSNPVLSTLHHFRDEYIAHVVEKRCPAGVCKSLVHYVIDPVKCKGCTLCAKNCPTDAISGVVRAPHVIDQEKCIKCGTCMDNCRFDAISKH